MKKAILFLLICSLLVMQATTAMAMIDEREAAVVSGGGAKFSYIMDFPNSFSVDSNGKATVAASVSASNVDSCKITIYLQRYENGSWSMVNQWSNSENGTSCYLSKTYYVQSGYSYRMKAYTNVYIDGVAVEGDSVISQTEIY